MGKYYYTALKDNKELVKGEVQASSPREARSKIRTLGFLPTNVYLEEASELKSVQSMTAAKSEKLSLQEKISFTSDLEVLVSSGIPVLEALNSIEMNSPAPKIKKVCSALNDEILNGSTFSEALEKLYGETFGFVYSAVIKTGEVSGELDKALERVLILLKKQKDMKDNIINASIYPAVLLVVMAAFLGLFSGFIFPRLYSVMAGYADIPFLTQILIDICGFINHFWLLIIMGVVAFGYSLFSMFKIPRFKRAWDKFILKVPVISDFITSINISNFLTVLYLSYEAGIPVLTCLELSGKTVGNYTLKDKVFKSVSLMREGETLTKAFERTKTVPPALMSMLAAGEKSGMLGKMFHDAADVMDKKVDMAIKALSKLFEPAVIIIIAFFVGFVALAFYQFYAAMWGSLL